MFSTSIINLLKVANIKSNKNMQSVDEIINEVCKRWGITEEELKGKSRLNIYVKARKEVAHKLRELGLSYPSIAQILGKEDHTTIINYFRK
jgi:chromosomal replication initiation ATPase DnaA